MGGKVLQLESERLRAEGEARAIEKGIKALVDSLKEYIPDEDALYQAVIKNEAYKDTPRETVQKYLYGSSIVENA